MSSRKVAFDNSFSPPKPTAGRLGHRKQTPKAMRRFNDYDNDEEEGNWDTIRTAKRAASSQKQFTLDDFSNSKPSRRRDLNHDPMLDLLRNISTISEQEEAELNMKFVLAGHWEARDSNEKFGILQKASRGLNNVAVSHNERLARHDDLHAEPSRRRDLNHDPMVDLLRNISTISEQEEAELNMKFVLAGHWEARDSNEKFGILQKASRGLNNVAVSHNERLARHDDLHAEPSRRRDLNHDPMVDLLRNISTISEQEEAELNMKFVLAGHWEARDSNEKLGILQKASRGLNNVAVSHNERLARHDDLHAEPSRRRDLNHDPMVDLLRNISTISEQEEAELNMKFVLEGHWEARDSNDKYGILQKASRGLNNVAVSHNERLARDDKRLARHDDLHAESAKRLARHDDLHAESAKRPARHDDLHAELAKRHDRSEMKLDRVLAELNDAKAENRRYKERIHQLMKARGPDMASHFVNPRHLTYDAPPRPKVKLAAMMKMDGRKASSDLNFKPSQSFQAHADTRGPKLKPAAKMKMGTTDGRNAPLNLFDQEIQMYQARASAAVRTKLKPAIKKKTGLPCEECIESIAKNGARCNFKGHKEQK